MKVFPQKSALALSAVLAAGLLSTVIDGAWAQTVITVGSGRAHDCFLRAKSGMAPRESVELCSAALQVEPLSKKDRAGTLDNRGVILDVLGRSNEAAKDFHDAIALNPDLGDAYVNLGSMLIKQGQHQAALDQINTGINLGMSFPHIGYYDRAVAEQMLGRYKEAYYDYKKALELEPNFVMASERLKDFVVTRVPANAPS
ncbi:MAG TPA: tetratricopeptide repeat protein [Rhizomicrobium sp.]|jgi:tetratricopeptide (TPR) repeat protein|nr:tetratricopeptide repeat protein [Rhizomicrobium sp.]